MTEQSSPSEKSSSCPYISIDPVERYYVCTLGDWGRDHTGRQRYLPISRDVVLNCLSEVHISCPTFRRNKRRLDESSGVKATG